MAVWKIALKVNIMHLSKVSKHVVCIMNVDTEPKLACSLLSLFWMYDKNSTSQMLSNTLFTYSFLCKFVAKFLLGAQPECVFLMVGLNLQCRSFTYKWASDTFKPSPNKFRQCLLCLSPSDECLFISQYAEVLNLMSSVTFPHWPFSR